MPISDSFIEELKFKNDIEDLVSSYVHLKRRGRNLIGLCPFHSEKTPSFNVYPESGSFYCFGCGVGGDIITFVERMENLDYLESVKFLASRVGLDVPENNNDDSLSKLKRKILEINRESAKFFYSMLYKDEGKSALSYLKNRGLSDSIIRKFGLGYSPNSRYELIDYLKEKGFSNSDLVQANIAYNNFNKSISARFFDRIMFPIIDLRGNVVAFGGRTMKDIKPKYLNTSDTIAFKKSDNLFSLNFAKSDPSKVLILVEGYMDVIALYKIGFKNAVATLGTALTQDQVKIISRYAKEVIIAYDSDEAGQKATQRAIELFKESDILVRIINIKGAKDPDEFAKKYGSEAKLRFQKILDNSFNGIEYQLRKEIKNHDISTSNGKISYLKNAVKILSSLNNKLEQEVYASKLSELVAVDKSTIMDQIFRENKRNRKINNKKKIIEIQKNLHMKKDNLNKEKIYNLRAATAEEALIAFVINNQDLACKIFDKLNSEKFCTEFNRKIYKCIEDRINSNRPISLTDLTSDFNKEEISKIAEFLAREQFRQSTFDDAMEYINVILSESEKLQKDNLIFANENDIREYILKLKEQKK